MIRIVPIWRYSCLRCDLIKCVKWYVKCLILHKYGKMTNILCSKDNNFHSIGLLNPKNTGADINITFLLHLVLDISFYCKKVAAVPILMAILNSEVCTSGIPGDFWYVICGYIMDLFWKKLACYEFCSPPTLMLLDYLLCCVTQKLRR